MVKSQLKLKVSFAALAAVLSLTTTACGNGGGSPDARVVDFSACDTKPDVGASALKSHASKTQWVVADYFNKPYDRYDLEAVLDASSTSTTEYVSSLGITLFKAPMPNAPRTCPTYFNLAAAPSPYSDIWTEISGGNFGGQGSLAGLFFEFCGKGTGASCRDRAMVQPTIIVNEVSDRWTIIHELMHYNFNQARKADPAIPTTDDIAASLGRLEKKLEKTLAEFQNISDRQSLADAALVLREIVELGHETHVRKSLEDVAIESLLIDEWSRGRLRNVSKRSAESGIWYIKYSKEKFEKEFPRWGEMVEKIQSTAEKNFWDDVIEITKNTQAQLDGFRTNLDGFLKDAENKVKNAENDFSEDSLLSPSLGFLSWGEMSASGPDRALSGADFVRDHDRLKFEQHLESHDHDGLQKVWDATTSRIEDLIESTPALQN